MKYYQITDAAKKVDVESHVLRYWEEELELPIERNKQGHRLYTEEDLNRFLYIKELKKEGLQLRAIRTKVHLRDKQLAQGGNAEIIFSKGQDTEDAAGKESFMADSMECSTEHSTNHSVECSNETMFMDGAAAGDGPQGEFSEKVPAEGRVRPEKHLPQKKNAGGERALQEEEKTRKAAKLCMMLQQMVSTAVHEENEKLMREIKKGVAETVSKEMNYQFSLQEQREEEHYKKLDEILREKERRGRLRHAAKQRMKKEKTQKKKEERAKVAALKQVKA